jgi:hypothetical protein
LNQEVVQGATVQVPVNIDTARPDGSTGMTEAILALRYDPRIFDVADADVQLGSVPSSSGAWQLTAAVNPQTGEIGIDLFGGNAVQSANGGSLVFITMHVRDTATVGASTLAIVNEVNPTGQRVYQTLVDDAQGQLVLHQTVTTAGVAPGAPGTVTVSSGQFALSRTAPIEIGNQIAVASGVNVLAATQTALPANHLDQAFEEFSQLPGVSSLSTQVSPLLSLGLIEQSLDVVGDGLAFPAAALASVMLNPTEEGPIDTGADLARKAPKKVGDKLLASVLAADVSAKDLDELFASEADE